ncbi:hypothetical protein LOTGIDRAFT_229745 [Lottia gigantea]|uniref:Mutator-like transposase domain-containing protein n=1 Tax=Lottia gigantea TaxID=225164 RepID=V3ZJX1_LOTGI|nr:hypothetical protein LOTGIDRAFT_229745 [Lottia gigantea]ESO82680.1 hypothetical protein LOTGIDRAFT_229745 [Lottia gigantea]
MVEMWNIAIQTHADEEAEVCAVPQFKINTEEKWGIGWKYSLKCLNCGYISPVVKLYREITTGKRGRKAAAVNINLQAGLLDMPLGNSRTRLLLADLDITPPAESGMSKLSSYVSSKTTDLNNESMRTKVEEVKNVNRRRGASNPNVINVALDGRYNCLTIGHSKKPGQGASQSIGIAWVLIKFATTDGDSTSATGIEEAMRTLHPMWKVERLADPAHLSASQFRQCFKAYFSDGMFRGKTKVEKTNQKKTLSQDIKSRYSGPKVIQYLAARLCGDYSSIHSCLREINLRDEDFQPHSMLDFGSGLGTSVWASTKLWKRITEFYCVDYSSDMNTVARLLLQDGKEDGYMKVPVVFRNKLPADYKFDLVISTYTLMEIKSEQERAKLIESLWNRTENYLVIVEKGSYSGFALIHETRQHLLKLSKQSKKGHIFSPCPHHEPCPKLKEKNSPCFFEARYTDLDQMEPEGLETEYFSYIIFRVGPKPNTESFPRIVDEPFKMKSCTHCHLCCSNGKLHHAVISSQEHEKDLYRCSRILLWGDMLPVRDKQLSDNNDVISEKDDMLPVRGKQISDNNDVISEKDDMLPEKSNCGQ